MEQFSLDKWLQDKSRKVVTRSGHNVRILCTDQRGNMPIVALVEFETLDGVQIFYSDGKNESHREYDLFFADEEEELTEFERFFIKCHCPIEPENLDKGRLEAELSQAKELLDLAKKEILKDLPKWKKAKKDEELDCHVAIQQDDRVVLSDFVQKDEYYITLDVLKTLPKEE